MGDFVALGIDDFIAFYSEDRLFAVGLFAVEADQGGCFVSRADNL